MKYMMMGAQRTKAERGGPVRENVLGKGRLLLALAARAEDRGADPNMGRAKAYRLLEIGAHAHAEECQPGAAGGLAQPRKMHRRLPGERRDAHQAVDRQVEPVAAFDDKVIGFGR